MKKTISKVKRQPSEWEKIIANETTDKELMCCEMKSGDRDRFLVGWENTMPGTSKFKIFGQPLVKD